MMSQPDAAALASSEDALAVHQWWQLWTRHRSAEWRPRRASVATCQQVASKLERLEEHNWSPNRAHPTAANRARLAEHDHRRCSTDGLSWSMRDSEEARSRSRATSGNRWGKEKEKKNKRKSYQDQASRLVGERCRLTCCWLSKQSQRSESFGEDVGQTLAGELAKQRKSLIYSMAFRRLISSDTCRTSWLAWQASDQACQAQLCCCCNLALESEFESDACERESARSINLQSWPSSGKLGSANRLTDYLTSSSDCCNGPIEHSKVIPGHEVGCPKLEEAASERAERCSSSKQKQRIARSQLASLTVTANALVQSSTELASDLRSRPAGRQDIAELCLKAARDLSQGSSIQPESSEAAEAEVQTQATSCSKGNQEKMLEAVKSSSNGAPQASGQIEARTNSVSSTSECSTDSGNSQEDQQEFCASQLEFEQDLNLESLIVESWLDDHPIFVRDYFMRKADHQLIDNWLVSQAKVRTNVRSSSVGHPTGKPTVLELAKYRQFDRTGTTRRSEVGAPVRKISATDLESRTGSGFLRPIVSTTPDGRPTFLAQSPVGDRSESTIGADETGADYGESKQIVSEQQIMRRNDDEVRLVFDLVKNICDDLDIDTLLHKILKNIAILINADKSSLFLVCGQAGDPNRHLMSQLFNVDQNDPLDRKGSKEERQKLDDSIVIPWGVGLVGYVAQSGESVNIENCYEDPRFTDAIDQRTGYKTQHMLCAPIYDKRNEIVGVAQVINKRDGKPFSESDQIKFKQYLQFCGIGLRNAQSYENCQLENKRNQVLLDLARMVFEEQSTIEQVVHRIMLHIQSLLECQRCQVLLLEDGSGELDQERYWVKARAEHDCSVATDETPEWRPQCHGKPIASEPKVIDRQCGVDAGSVKTARESEEAPRMFSLVFNLDCGDNGFVMHTQNAGRQPFPVNIGITSHVARTGETLNIEDAHKDVRFDRSVDEGSNFRHKSILCMPIKDGQRRLIGVSQLINKKDGRAFNKNDENLFEAFAIFCGLGIHNTLMYERVLKIMAKQRVTFEVLSYHASAPLEQAKKLDAEQVPSCYSLNLGSLKFNDFSLDESNMLKSCLRFFLDLDLMRRFQIDKLVFCRWILSVQKNYRKVTYHPIVGEYERISTTTACLANIRSMIF